MPPSTKILCPHCQTPNPRDRFYCDNCGKRLVEESLPKKEEPKPEKGSPQKFFLPERDLNDLSGMEPGAIPDWMKSGEMPGPGAGEGGEDELPSIEELAPLRKTTDELPTWLVDNIYSSAPPFEPPKEITTDNFLELLRATENEMDMPEDMAKAASEADLPDWLSDVVPAATGALSDKPKQPQPSPPQEGDAEDWLTQLGPGHTDLLEKGTQTVDEWESEEEEADWLEELGPAHTAQLGDDKADDGPPSGILKTSEFADQVLAGDRLPDWLQELGPPQTGQLAEEKPVRKPASADEPPISGIFESDEFAAQVRQALGTDEIPDWLKELGPAQTKPFDETAVPDAPQDEIREWMTQIGPPTGMPDIAGVPDFDALQHTRNATTDDEDDNIYDWLKEPSVADVTDKVKSDRVDFANVFADEPITEIDGGGEELLDWLHDLGPTETGQLADDAGDELDFDLFQTEEPAADEPLSDVSSDWLAELDFADGTRARKEEETGDDLDASFLRAASLIDEEPISTPTGEWLSELSPEQIELEQDDDADTLGSGFFDALTDDEETTDDWLSELGPAYTAELPTSDTADSGMSKQTTELPDWLTELGPPQTNVLSSPSSGALDTPAPGASDELPDLFGMGPPAGEVALPDWLSFDEDEPVAGAADVIEDAAAETAEPFSDFFDDIPPDDTEQVTVDPDWLAEITSLGEDAFTGELELPEAPLDVTEPIEAEPPKLSEVVEEPEPESPIEFEGFFDFGDEDEDSATTTSAAEEVDEWITSAELEEEEVPEWLSQLGQAVSESDKGFPSESPAEETDLIVEDLPEWLSHMRPSTDAHASSLSGLSAQEASMADAFEAIPTELIGADLPAWLEDVTKSSFITEEGEAGISEEIPDIPDWLKAGLKDGADFLGKQEPDITNQLSALLDELPPAHDPRADLAKADIPDWIQALKPKEPDAEVVELERPLQESGPLSGIRGVIEIEPTIATPHAATTSLAAFTITKEQQQQMQLLRQLSYDTAPATAVSPTVATRASALIRTILALLLVGAILVGLLGPNLLRSTPSPTPALAAVHEAIQAAAGQPVLVAFEYTPAMAAELTPQAELLLTQLAANGSPVVLVSQYTTGIALANNQEQVYVPGTPFFIPGEAIGLRELATCLQEPCTTIAGHFLETDLQQTFANVSLLIVLTGERDSLVNWIEQVSTPSNQPILVGIPQSLQPVAAPYMTSGQLQGMIAGLPDTAVYNQAYQNGTDSDILTQLNAQHLAQIFILVFLIVGGVSASFNRTASPAKTKKQKS